MQGTFVNLCYTMENHAIATMMTHFGSTDHGLGTEIDRVRRGVHEQQKQARVATDIYQYICIQTYIYSYVLIYVNLQIYVQIFLHIYIRIYACTHTHKYIYIYTYVYIYIYICIYIYIYIYMHIHVYIYISQSRATRRLPFFIATTPRCREGCHIFPWTAPLFL